MKVCHLTSVHPVTDLRILKKECISLKDAGYEVHLIATNTSSMIIDGVNIHSVESKKNSRMKRMTRVVKDMYIKALEIDAEVYHFHDPELIPVGKKLSKKGKKVIYDVHEDVPRQILTKHWINPILKPIISFLFEKYENASVKNFDLIVAATPHIEERFSKLKVNTINVNNYPIIKDKRNEDITRNKSKSFCYVGGITRSRGIFEMINAIERVDTAKLIIAGKFSSQLDEQEAKETIGWSKVIDYGYVDQEQIQKIYEESMAGFVILHPEISYIDSLPVKMFEYMEAGIPLIGSDFPLWKSIIEKNRCGICVNPLDSDEITTAIEYFLENPEIAQEMGRNGRRAVEENYNWKNESSKLINAYNKLL